MYFLIFSFLRGLLLESWGLWGSGDLNPLDFRFWGEAQGLVCREQQPWSVEDVVQCVRAFAAACAASVVGGVADPFLRELPCVSAAVVGASSTS